MVDEKEILKDFGLAAKKTQPEKKSLARRADGRIRL